LAKGLCEQWDWRDGRGRLKDFAARSLLLKLAATKQIELPPLQENKATRPSESVCFASLEEPIVNPRLCPSATSAGRRIQSEQSPGSGGLSTSKPTIILGCEWSGRISVT